MALADRQTFNRVAGTVEAKMVSWLAAMLTDTISMPTDGPKVTADNDGAGKSPINFGLKDLANMITGLAGSIFGNIVGVTQRTMKSLHIDGTGGLASAAASNTARISNVLSTTVVGPGGVDITGAATGIGTFRDSYLRFENTVAGGSNPAKTAAGANKLDALMIPKAWAWWSTDGAGGITLDDGGRITSATIVVGHIRLTFATPFDNSTYATVVHCENVTGGASFNPLLIETAAWIELDCGALDPSTTVLKGRAVMFGRQTT